jgi:hypothetical protein
MECRSDASLDRLVLPLESRDDRSNERAFRKYAPKAHGNMQNEG